MSEQIFISYRRQGGDLAAKLIGEVLKNHGYTVFYDYDSIKGEYFDERIKNAITNCNDFLLILPPNALDRCNDDKDWVRFEIKCALNFKKNIIPIILPGFSFPDVLPKDISEVKRINAIIFSLPHFNRSVIPSIIERLRPYTRPNIKQPSGNTEQKRENCDYGLSYYPDIHDRACDKNIGYYYYSQLNAKHKQLYDSLYKAICKYNKTVKNEEYVAGDVIKVTKAILCDHPELFWFNYADWANSKTSRIRLVYGVSKEDRDIIQKRIDEVVPRYLAEIDDSMSAYDVAVRLHSIIIRTTEYDSVTADKRKYWRAPDDDIDYPGTICGVFLNKKAIGQGYVRSLQYLLHKCGVECAQTIGTVRSESEDDDEEWTGLLIKIDGDYYHIATLWGNQQDNFCIERSLTHFCITTDELTATRKPNLCPTDIPICIAQRANFYCHNSLILTFSNGKLDLDKLKKLSLYAAKSKKYSFSFKCADDKAYGEIINHLSNCSTDMKKLYRRAFWSNMRIRSGYTYSCVADTKNVTFIFNHK